MLGESFTRFVSRKQLCRSLGALGLGFVDVDGCYQHWTLPVSRAVTNADPATGSAHMSPSPFVVASGLEPEVETIRQKSGRSGPRLGEGVPFGAGPNWMTNAPAPQEAIFESGMNTKVPTMAPTPTGLAETDDAKRAVPAMSPEKVMGANPIRAQMPLGSGPLWRHSSAALVTVAGSNTAEDLTGVPDGTVVLGAVIGAAVVVVAFAIFAFAEDGIGRAIAQVTTTAMTPTANWFLMFMIAFGWVG